MADIKIKVVKPFSYAGAKKKVGDVFFVPKAHGEALILVNKAERVKPTTQKRTYRTRQAKPTNKPVMEAES